jgi:hypothetical protein
MGVLPLLLIPVSLWVTRGRDRALILGWGLGYLLYGLFLPYQIYSHSYYSLQLIPFLAIASIPATEAIINSALVYCSRLNRRWRMIVGAALIALVVGVLVYTSWLAVFPQWSRDSRAEPAFWEEVATQLPDGKIVALTQDYGYRIMYYGWRKVTLWPNRGEQKLSELRDSEKEFLKLFENKTEEISFFLITSFTQFDDQPILKAYLYEHYPILVEGNGYLIFDLRPKP